MKNKEKRKEYCKRQYLKRKADSETFHKIKQHVRNSYEKSKETKKEYFKQQYLKQKTCGKLKTKQKNTTNIQSDTEDVQLDSAKAYSLSDDNLHNFVSYVDAEAKQKKRQRRTCSKIDLEQDSSQIFPNENLLSFHNSMKMTITQCAVCKEAWPLCDKRHKESHRSHYVCYRCKRDKKEPKKFSFENSVIPSAVPPELQNMTQFEEMLIARAFPVINVYTKPKGGQRAYKGHVINCLKMFNS